jgi:hypothetical protein
LQGSFRLLFSEEDPEKPASAPPPHPLSHCRKQAIRSLRGDLQFANKTGPAPVKPAEPAKIAPSSVSSVLDDEELKIPSWLEPLARNAAAPSSTSELIEREKAKRQAEQSTLEEIAPETTTDLEEGHAPELQAPNFGSDLNSIDQPSSSVGSRKSGEPIVCSDCHRHSASGDARCGTSASNLPVP